MNIPENLKQAMKTYAVNHELIEQDLKLIQLNMKLDDLLEKVNALNLEIEKESEPYLSAIRENEEYIKAQVLELDRSVEFVGVKVSHRKAHERISWNNNAMSSILLLNPNLAPIFTPARKVTDVKPSVTVKYLGPLEEEIEPESESVQFSREDYEAKTADTKTADTPF